MKKKKDLKYTDKAKDIKKTEAKSIIKFSNGGWLDKLRENAPKEVQKVDYSNTDIDPGLKKYNPLLNISPNELESYRHASTISKTPARGTLSKITDQLSHPVRTAGYLLSGQDLPNYYNPSESHIGEDVLNIINPMTYLNAANRIGTGQNFKGVTNPDQFVNATGSTLLDIGAIAGISDGYNPTAIPGKIMGKAISKVGKLLPVSATTGELGALAKGNQWLKDWNNNPIIQDRMNNLGVRVNDINTEPTVIAQNPLDKFLTKKVLKNNVMGTYSSLTDEAVVDLKNATSLQDIESTTVHEGTHKSTVSNKLLNKDTKDLLKSPFGGDLGIANAKYLSDQSKDLVDYMTDPTEIHARVNELRNYYNIKPETVISNESASYMLDAIHEGITPVDPSFVDIMQASQPYVSKRVLAKQLANVMNKMFTPAAIITGAKVLSNNSNNWLDNYK